MNREEHLLTVLSEECAEVIKEVTKSLRFGLNDHKPGNPTSNAQRITNELGDLLGIMEMLIDENIIKPPEKSSAENKKSKVEKYLKYSAHIGKLDKMQMKVNLGHEYRHANITFADHLPVVHPDNQEVIGDAKLFFGPNDNIIADVEIANPEKIKKLKEVVELGIGGVVKERDGDAITKFELISCSLQWKI